MSDVQGVLDEIAELVEDRYPQGTTDPYGKALRHQLHKLGRLNEPPKEVTEAVKAINEALMVAAFALHHHPSGSFKRKDPQLRQAATLVRQLIWSCLPGGGPSDATGVNGGYAEYGFDKYALLETLEKVQNWR